jgi:hypothetical protein
MNLQEFRALETDKTDRQAAQKDWIANILIGQNPRLRRGEDMTGPIMMCLDGKYVADLPGYPYPPPPRPATPIKAYKMQISEAQLDFHPWIDLPEQGNWLHMYNVELRSPFMGMKPGDFVVMPYRDHSVTVELTQFMIDETTTIWIGFGISK